MSRYLFLYILLFGLYNKKSKEQKKKSKERKESFCNMKTTINLIYFFAFHITYLHWEYMYIFCL